MKTVGPLAERADYAAYLLRLAEREVQDREVRAAERRVQAARFPVGAEVAAGQVEG